MALSLILASCNDGSGSHAKSFTVTFSANGGKGKAPAAQTVKAGSSITLPGKGSLTKTGCTFGGWNTSADGTGTNYAAGSSYTVTGTITLYAKWDSGSATTYTVTYDINGGTGTTPATQTAGSGSSIILPGKDGLTKTGCAFGGWNTNADGTGISYAAGASYTVTGDITLYAKWDSGSVAPYTVTFDINGGTGTTPAAQTAKPGFSITLPGGSGLSRTNYTFGGWNTGADGVGTAYSAGSSYEVIGDAILYAKWNIITYNVTFSANGGNGTAPNAMSAQAGSSITFPNGSGLTKTGYAFTGWNTNADGTGTTYRTDAAYTLDADTALYAKWVDAATTYTVRFHANYGMGITPDNQIVTVGSSITIPNESGLTRINYTFGGWNTNADSTGTTYNTGSSYVVVSDVILYAKWDGIPYTVTFNVNGGSGAAPNAMSAPNDSSITLPNGNGFSRTGYTFAGWNTNTNSTGTNYSAGDLYKVTGGNTTLYARWDGAVTFNINGGTGTTPAVQTASSGSSITLPKWSGFIKTGYVFAGWNANANGTGTNYAVGASYTITGNITLYARWNQLIFEMVNVPGGSFQMGRNLGTSETPDETPVHTVTLSGFSIGKYEVTQEQYQAVIGTNPSQFVFSDDSNHMPVERVTWYDAIEFCNKLSEVQGLTPYYTINKTTGSDPNNTSEDDPYRWLVTRNTSANGYRLPTEAQWEYAAKGGNGSPGSYTYAGSNTIDGVAWYVANSDSSSHAVGTKTPNALGLYDMTGNIWEWCWDWLGNYSDGAQSDPLGASSGSFRIARGGSWNYAAELVRCVSRGYVNPSNKNFVLGLRLVR